jgi:hypothetical protein
MSMDSSNMRQMLAERLGRLRNACRDIQRVHESAKALFEPLRGRLEAVCAELERKPAVKLRSLKYETQRRQPFEHARAMELVGKSARLVAEVSAAAAASGFKEQRSILRLCGRILLELCPAAGSAVVGLSCGDGEFTAAIFAAIARGSVCGAGLARAGSGVAGSGHT